MLLSFMTFFLVAAAPTPAKEIRAVIFDFGKVVVKNKDLPPMYQFLETTFHLSAEESRALFLERKHFNINGGTDEEFFEAVFKRRNQRMPVDFLEKFERATEKMVNVNPGVWKIIQALKKSRQIHLFSNTEKYRADLYEKMGLYDPFDQKYLSFEIGLSKPDARAYKFVMEHSRLKPEECLFIDDKIENVIAAKEHRWHAIHYKNADQLEIELKKIGLDIRAELK